MSITIRHIWSLGKKRAAWYCDLLYNYSHLNFAPKMLKSFSKRLRTHISGRSGSKLSLRLHRRPTNAVPVTVHVGFMIDQ